MLPVVASEECLTVSLWNYFSIHRLIHHEDYSPGPFGILSTFRWPTIASARAWVGRSRPPCCTRHMQPASDYDSGDRRNRVWGKNISEIFGLEVLNEHGNGKFPPFFKIKIHLHSGSIFQAAMLEVANRVVGGLADQRMVLRSLLWPVTSSTAGQEVWWGASSKTFSPLRSLLIRRNRALGEIFVRFLLRCFETYLHTAPKHVTRCGVGKIPLGSNYLSFDLWFFMTCPIYWEMTSTASTISTISKYPHPCPGHGVWPDHLGLLQLVLPCLRYSGVDRQACCVFFWGLQIDLECKKK